LEISGSKSKTQKCMKKLLLFLLLIPALCFGQMARTDSIYNGIKFIEYYPTKLKPEGIIFSMGGLGQIGNNLDMVADIEIGRLIEAGAEYPYIIICPQIPLNKGTSWSKTIILTCLKIIDGYKITPRHVTGLSLGGTGTWDAVRFAPQGFFETACVVTGRTSTYDSAKWHSVRWKIYHGTQDKTYNIQADRKCYQYLLRIGANATMKELIADHKIWPFAYRDSEYWEFLKPRSSIIPLLPSQYYLGNGGATLTH
jgi:predicted peptidase